MFWSMLLMLASAPSVEAPRINAFAKLREGYRTRNAQTAAEAYAVDATLTYRYSGTPEELHVGTGPIAVSFRQLFDQVDPADAIDLNFRATEKSGSAVKGFYRMRIGKETISYGRFDVTLTHDGRFLTDSSSEATSEDFEDAAGPVMLAPDNEILDRGYYAALTGRYVLPDGCKLVVTRSIVRLFVRNSCTQQWRGLTRLSGRLWAAGDRVLSNSTDKRYRFSRSSRFTQNASATVEVLEGNSLTTAVRDTAYRTEDVAFSAADGTRLTGTLYLPSGSADRRPASVMIHGSGPQDRDGYASIIAVMADEMAAAGRIVLTYDKRGSGGSDGDGDRAGFDLLAADARAAMAYLATREDVDAAAIGLAGSSQAGWVAAKAIAEGSKPADVFLLGAAGAAMNVREQNLYNTEVQMRCGGVAASDIKLALRQQAAFFDYLANPKRAAALDEITATARKRTKLADWLFPDSRSIDRSGGAWYSVLDPAFDPLPIWRNYKGRTAFLFGSLDDATPTPVAIKRLRKSPVTTVKLSSAQHLGLIAKDKCKAGLNEVSAFSPALMQALADFARNRSR